MKLTVADLLQISPREIRHREKLRRPVTGVSTDSRTVATGDLFVALRGPSFDGHQFVAKAADRGARAAMVEAGSVRDEWVGIPLVVVDDTTRALGVLAKVYRSKFDIPVIAVGGSSGKTTTKDMITAVLGRRYRVLSTERNFNNHVGVPATLFRLTVKHEIAVVEVGTNHPGELSVLCDILDPTHGLLTNIGAEHLEFFHSLDGVEEEEGVLFGVLRGQRRGVAIVNVDDKRVVRSSRGRSERLTYGFSSRGAGVRGSRLVLDGAACASFEFSGLRAKRPVRVSLGVPGRHQAMNALAAAAVGLLFRVPGREIAEALGQFRASDKRMAVLEESGVRILNDTYNANPDSTIAALETLAAMNVAGKRIAVLGDMLELGGEEVAAHRRVGQTAARLQIDILLTFGGRAREIHEAAQMSGALHYEQKNVLAEYLVELVGPGDVVLLKGSRGMAMEDVVSFLVAMLRERAAQVAVDSH